MSETKSNILKSDAQEITLILRLIIVSLFFMISLKKKKNIILTLHPQLSPVPWCTKMPLAAALAASPLWHPLTVAEKNVLFHVQVQ